MRFFSLSRLIKFAGAEEKIKDFQITDPWVAFFIKKYEGLIAWNGYEIPIRDPENPDGDPKILQFKIRPENKEKDIVRYVKNVLLPQLYRKVDINHAKMQGSYYFTKVDMQKIADNNKKRNIVNPEFERAYTVFLEDPKAGEEIYVEYLNQIKKNGFDTWTSYLKDHPDFSDEPIFIFLLLDKVFATSKNKDVNPVVAGTPPVIGELYQAYRDADFRKENAITDKKDIDFIISGLFPKDPTKEPKNYEQIAEELTQNRQAAQGEGAEIPEPANQVAVNAEDVEKTIKRQYLKDGNFVDLYNLSKRNYFERLAKQEAVAGDGNAYWKYYPRKDKLKPEVSPDGKALTAQEVFDRNLDDCTALSEPQGWCTTRVWFGIQHLTNGDFWIYVVNGVAEVGIRWFGEDIEEIAGPQNKGDRSCPRKHWREIIKFIAEKGWEKHITGPYAVSHWKEILKEKEQAKNFFNADGTLNQDEVSSFAKLIESSPQLYNRLDLAQFHAYPAAIAMLQEACIVGWGRSLADFRADQIYRVIENLQNNILPDMPEFVRNDPRLIVAVHGRLASGYEKNPNYLRYVLQSVPDHLKVYPQGKNIFKNAVLDVLRTGIFWHVRAVGVTKKTPEEKNRIKKSREVYEGLIKTIGDCVPELLEDAEFQAAMEAAKQESIAEAVKDGYVAREMPNTTVEDYLQSPENFAQLQKHLVTKIVTAPGRAKSDATKLRVQKNLITEKFMISYINATAPAKMRRGELFNKLKYAVIKEVLSQFILQFPIFEEKYKDDIDLYTAYKNKMLNIDVARLMLEYQGKPEFDRIFDQRLLQDPDFQRKLAAVRENVDTKKIRGIVQTNPSNYLKLDEQIKEIPEVQDAYILSRAKAQSNKRILILKEWALLPALLKNRPDAQDGYRAAAIESILRNVPNSEFYLLPDGVPNKFGISLQPEFFADQQIIDEFRKRDERTGKRASTGWYTNLYKTM